MVIKLELQWRWDARSVSLAAALAEQVFLIPSNIFLAPPPRLLVFIPLLLSILPFTPQHKSENG
jgi:hypothetical protein